jgi:hypothetical protein
MSILTTPMLSVMVDVAELQLASRPGDYAPDDLAKMRLFVDYGRGRRPDLTDDELDDLAFFALALMRRSLKNWLGKAKGDALMRALVDVAGDAELEELRAAFASDSPVTSTAGPD